MRRWRTSEIGQRVGLFLNANVRPSEAIAVFDEEPTLGIRHYYRGAARVVPLPRTEFYRFRQAHVRALECPGHVWLVFGITACSMVEIGASCTLLDAYVAKHFKVMTERRFKGTTVRELQVRASPSAP